MPSTASSKSNPDLSGPALIRQVSVITTLRRNGKALRTTEALSAKRTSMPLLILFQGPATGRQAACSPKQRRDVPWTKSRTCISAGDLDGLLGLRLNNLVQIALIIGLCRGVLGFPDSLLFERILPATGISLLLGNLAIWPICRCR